MKSKDKNRYPWGTRSGRLALLFLYLALLSIYPGLNHPWGTVHSVALPLDAHIPLVPLFVIPYLFFFFPWAIVLLLWLIKKDPISFGRLIISLILGTAISYLFYLFFQTVVYRDEVVRGDIFSDLVRWVYQSDARYNAFPSTHTVTTTILLFSTLRLFHRPALRLAAILVAASILLSTLFIRQHHVADVLLGICVGGCSFWAATRLVSVRASRQPARRIATPRAKKRPEPTR